MATLMMIMFLFLYPRHREENQKSGDVGALAQSRLAAEKIIHKASEHSSTKLKSEQNAGQSRRQQKIAISAARRLSVAEQLVHHYPYDINSKFPTFIWQTWKYTPASGRFEEQFRVTEASWTEKHPGFIHQVITDEVAEQLIAHLYSGIPDVLEAYRSMPLPILKVDLFRYLILFARGGIYADIDTFVLKGAQEWIPPSFNLGTVGLVVGIEADPDRDDWHSWYSRRVQFCQWTIQAKTGHPVLLAIISQITEETLKRKRMGTLKPDRDDVIEFTGPAAWTDAIFAYFNNPEYFDMTKSNDLITPLHFTGMKAAKMVGDVVVLPITCFSPGIGHSGAGDIEDPMAFVKHEFAGTWKPENERMIGPTITPEQAAEAKAEQEREELEKQDRERAQREKEDNEEQSVRKGADGL